MSRLFDNTAGKYLSCTTPVTGPPFTVARNATSPVALMRATPSKVAKKPPPGAGSPLSATANMGPTAGSTKTPSPLARSAKKAMSPASLIDG